MKTLITKSMLCAVLSMSINSAVLCAQEKPEYQSEMIENDSLNYGTHVVTGGVAQITVWASILAGLVVGDIAARNNCATWVHRALNLNPPLAPGFLTENYNLLLLTRLVPFIACSTTGLYVMYKMPQWTDTHILHKDIIRTTKQNIIAFLNRIMLPYPIGVLTGEYMSHPATTQKTEKRTK